MIKKKIITIVSQTLGINEKEVVPEANLYEDFNCSQLEIHDLMQKICREYMIDDRNCSFDNITTVDDIIRFTESYSDEI